MIKDMKSGLVKWLEWEKFFVTSPMFRTQRLMVWEHHSLSQAVIHNTKLSKTLVLFTTHQSSHRQAEFLFGHTHSTTKFHTNARVSFKSFTYLYNIFQATIFNGPFQVEHVQRKFSQVFGKCHWIHISLSHTKVVSALTSINVCSIIMTPTRCWNGYKKILHDTMNRTRPRTWWHSIPTGSRLRN